MQAGKDKGFSARELVGIKKHKGGVIMNSSHPF